MKDRDPIGQILAHVGRSDTPENRQVLQARSLEELRDTQNTLEGKVPWLKEEMKKAVQKLLDSATIAAASSRKKVVKTFPLQRPFHHYGR